MRRVLPHVTLSREGRRRELRAELPLPDAYGVEAVHVHAAEPLVEEKLPDVPPLLLEKPEVRGWIRDDTTDREQRFQRLHLHPPYPAMRSNTVVVEHNGERARS